MLIEISGAGSGANYPCAMAVSAKGKLVATDVSSSVSQAARQLVGIYNVNGVKLDTLAKGVSILKFADGTTRKVVVDKA